MQTEKALSPHSQQVLSLLETSGKPLSAYDILDQLRGKGIKAPPTVYRALETLIARGLVHRIESLNAFMVCASTCSDHDEKSAQFAVCRACGTVTEIHDHRLMEVLREVALKLKFRVERDMLETAGAVPALPAAGGGLMFYWSAWGRMALSSLVLFLLWALTFWAVGGMR